jgi:hypothetical protein
LNILFTVQVLNLLEPIPISAEILNGLNFSSPLNDAATCLLSSLVIELDKSPSERLTHSLYESLFSFFSVLKIFVNLSSLPILVYLV